MDDIPVVAAAAASVAPAAPAHALAIEILSSAEVVSVGGPPSSRSVEEVVSQKVRCTDAADPAVYRGPHRPGDDKPSAHDSLDDTALFSYTTNPASGAVTRSLLFEQTRRRGREALVLHPGPAVDDSPAPASIHDATAEDRCLGAILGMIVGDALGAPLEFMTPLPGGAPPSLSGMGEAALLPGRPCLNAFGLAAGQWTDDASMGLCLLDSLLAASAPSAAASASAQPVRATTLDQRDLMLRFCAWWHCGYNNAFGRDAARLDRESIGLGGTIAQSLEAFLERDGQAETRTGSARSSGNGSIMRMAAAAAAHHADEHAAADCAREQSRTTHRGVEAAECAALMATAICRAAHSAEADPAARKEAVLDSLADFAPRSDCPSIVCLANGEAERLGGAGSAAAGASVGTAELSFPVDPDRDWRWRSADHSYAPARVAEQRGYVGLYAMDALAMALHCVWCTFSFREAVLLAANWRGDADSVAAVTGQLAGAIYGLAAIPREWLAAVEQWDGGGLIRRKARCLFARASRAAAADGSGRAGPFVSATAASGATAGPPSLSSSSASASSSSFSSSSVSAGERGPPEAGTERDSKRSRVLPPALISALADAGIDADEAVAVRPLEQCAHADTAAAAGAFDLARLAGFDVAAPCASCGACGENWVCLICGHCGCSSYVAGHARAHAHTGAPALAPSAPLSSSSSSSPSLVAAPPAAPPAAPAPHGCCLAYSLADGSVWCYACEAYLDAFLLPALHAPVRALYINKFGVEPVFPQPQPQPQPQLQLHLHLLGSGAGT